MVYLETVRTRSPRPGEYCSASVIIIFTPVQINPVDELLENLEARRPVEAGVISIDRLSIID